MMHADTGLLRSPSLNTSSLPPFLLNSANCAISCWSVVGATLTVFSDINWGRERDCGILCGKKTREVSKAVLFSVRSKQSTQLHTHVIATPSRAGTNLQLADSISVTIRLCWGWYFDNTSQAFFFNSSNCCLVCSCLCLALQPLLSFYKQPEGDVLQLPGRWPDYN